MHSQADRATNPSQKRHFSPPTSPTTRGRTSGTTTQTDTSSRLNPGKSQGRPKTDHGLTAHRTKRPTRLRSPKKAPVPDRRTVGPGPDGPSEHHFHAATATALCRASDVSAGAVRPFARQARLGSRSDASWSRRSREMLEIRAKRDCGGFAPDARAVVKAGARTGRARASSVCTRATASAESSRGGSTFAGSCQRPGACETSASRSPAVGR